MLEIKAEIFLKYRGSLRDGKNCYVVFLNDCATEKFKEGRIQIEFFELWRVFPSRSLNLCLASSAMCLNMWIAFFTWRLQMQKPS